jgi:hypothetical protein
MIEELEQMRVFSQLSEGFHQHRISDSYYGFIGGYTLPLSVASAFMLWCIVGKKLYETLITDEDAQMLARLNAHDDYFKTPRDRMSIITHLYSRISNTMQGWDSKSFEAALNELGVT